MAYGLGPNSPIILQLSRENFDALIVRHGQYIRWLSAQKCPCVKENRKVDPQCPVCNGKGVFYISPYEAVETARVSVVLDDYVKIPENTGIVWIRDLKGNNLDVGSSCEGYAYVPGVKKGSEVLVQYNESIKLSGSYDAEYIGNKTFRVDIPYSTSLGEVQGTLLSVVTEEAVTIGDIRRNTFTITEDGWTTDLPVTCEYLKPLVFAILSQGLKDADRRFLSDISGDCVMTFPQKWKVFDEDIIIALNSESEGRSAFVASGGDYDSLPEFYVASIGKCYARRSGVLHEFLYETDFVLYRGNQIKWISLNRPDEGEVVSVNYSFNVTYKVIKDFPSPRTSENNWFPRRVALKQYSHINTRETF